MYVCSFYTQKRIDKSQKLCVEISEKCRELSLDYVKKYTNPRLGFAAKKTAHG